MKLFLSSDITYNKANDELGGNEFIVETVSHESAKTLENASENVENVILKARIPRWLTVIEWLSFLVGMSLIGAIIDALSGQEPVSLAHAYTQAPWFFWLAGVCMIVWLTIFLYSYKKKAEVMKSEETKMANEKVDQAVNSIMEELDIPEDAVAVDILSCSYRMKNGKVRPKDDLFINFEFRLHTENGQLVLADTESKYAIDLDKFKGISAVDEKVYLASWNKDRSIKDEKYREYKLREDSVGLIIVKRYYILEFTHENELFGICFPNYELPAIEALTGLRA